MTCIFIMILCIWFSLRRSSKFVFHSTLLMLIFSKIKHGIFSFSKPLYKLQSKLLTMFGLTQPSEKSYPVWIGLLVDTVYNTSLISIGLVMGSHGLFLPYFFHIFKSKVKTDICLLPSSLSSTNRGPAGWLDHWCISHHAHASLSIYQTLACFHSCSWQGCYLHAKLNLESEILAETLMPVSGFLHAPVKSCQRRQINPGCAGTITHRWVEHV